MRWCWLLRAKLHLPMYAIKDLDDSWKFILKRRIIETERGLRMLRVGWMLRARVLLSTCVRNFVILPFKALEGIWICLFIYLFIYFPLFLWWSHRGGRHEEGPRGSVRAMEVIGASFIRLAHESSSYVAFSLLPVCIYHLFLMCEIKNVWHKYYTKKSGEGDLVN